MVITEGINECLEKIFGAILVGGLTRKEDQELREAKKAIYQVCMPEFLARFNDNIFQDEYAFLYEVVKELKIKVFTPKQMKDILENNADDILKSPYINFKQWERIGDGRSVSNEEKILAFETGLNELFIRLSYKYVTEEEYNSACEMYIGWYKDELMVETTQNMALMMQDEVILRKPHGKSRRYKGTKDVQKYYSENIKIIQALDEENMVRHVKIDSKWLEEERKSETKVEDEALIDFGIPEIDEKVGVLRRSNMIEFVGPPKGGKTTLAQFLTERCLEKGLNVCVWPLEGTKKEWTTVITCLMVRKSADSIALNKNMVMLNRYNSEKEKQCFLSAKQMLATDKKRGRLSFIEGTCYVETFREVLDNHYDTENQFDVVVIDSPINIMSLNNLGKVARISDGYMYLKDYVANKMKKKALCVVTAQLKQEVIDFIRKNPNETLDVTAGGESAETIRTPDEVIGLFSSKKERAAGQMKMYSIASRHSEDFDDFYIGCQLGCGYFFSKPELNNNG